MAASVEHYLTALDKQDWAALDATLTDGDFERVGPFRDIVGSRREYVEFLERVVSPLGEYHVTPDRVVATERVVYAEIVESFVHAGEKLAYPEVLVFDLDGKGLINRVQVFMMRPGEQPPVEGASA
ncbi:MAG: nuclear transport factor 2 family protein [Acidimicrobiaceae bacterium]|nr:nuclear transport factor 2 family protein [Acidimicrobiaceae bacterium]